MMAPSAPPRHLSHPHFTAKLRILPFAVLLLSLACPLFFFPPLLPNHLSTYYYPQHQPLVALAALHPTERAALEQIRASVDNPAALGWPDSSSSSDPCEDDWPNMGCGKDPILGYHFVSSLQLSNLELGGKLPPAIALLPSLRALFLGGNGFTGPVPEELSRLIQLEQVGLDHNELTFLPPNLFVEMSNLQKLFLLRNPLLNTSIPSLASNVNLQILDMGSCQLTGNIPADFSNLVSLTNVSLGNNGLSGHIPPSAFGPWQPNLRSLRLNNNQLAGPIPESLGEAPLLAELWLHGNDLSGTLPASLVRPDSLLQSVQLSHNQLTGTIPETLGEVSSLQVLQLNSNDFVGPMPSFAAKFGATSFEWNGFCTEFGAAVGTTCSSQVLSLLDVMKGFGYPPSLAAAWKGNSPCGSRGSNGWAGIGCSGDGLVDALILPNQNLTGVLSPSLANLTSLRLVQLQGNDISGSVPEELARLPRLISVNIANNNFSGVLPLFWPKTTVSSGGNSFTIPSPPAVPVPSSQKPPIASPSLSPSPSSPVLKPVTPPSSPTLKPSPSSKAVPPKGSPSLPSPAAPANSPANPSPSIPSSISPSLPSPTPSYQSALSTPSPSPSVPAPSPPLSTSQKTSGGGSSNTSLVIALVVVLLVLLLAGCGLCFFFFVWRKRKQRPSTRVGSSGTDSDPSSPAREPPHATATIPLRLNGGQQDFKIRIDPSILSRVEGAANPGDDEMVIRIEVIKAATSNFAPENIIGKGGFGTVYMGTLPDGTLVAVKRMEMGPLSQKGLAEFQAEIGVLTAVRHRHLVGLLGYVIDGFERLLVYEYMEKGPLSRHLFEHKALQLKPLDWKTRLSVALDVARGMEYLHGLAANRVFIHRDLKPSNILLDSSFRAKVSDFGLVKQQQQQGGVGYSIETRLAGTFGYLAPEYAVTGKVTTRSDVYSFGVVLMELITGRRALDDSESEETAHLATWFPSIIPNRDQLAKAVDPTLAAEIAADPSAKKLVEEGETFLSVCTVADLALHCTQRDPKQRPQMSDAVAVLTPLVQRWKPQDPLVDQTGGIDMAISLAEAIEQWKVMEEGDDLPGDYVKFGYVDEREPLNSTSSDDEWYKGAIDGLTKGLGFGADFNRKLGFDIQSDEEMGGSACSSSNNSMNLHKQYKKVVDGENDASTVSIPPFTSAFVAAR